eukprot:COSAG05_NODE_23150_length_260_cov_0.602484_1_plen_86_part_11
MPILGGVGGGLGVRRLGGVWGPQLTLPTMARKVEATISRHRVTMILLRGGELSSMAPLSTLSFEFMRETVAHPISGTLYSCVLAMS